MRRATQALSRGHWPEAEASAGVRLDYDARHRRRIRLDCDDGSEILLDLEKAVALQDGDGLRIEGGSWIVVHAAPEDLAEVTAPSAHDLHRIAWHLGNRHCPAQLDADRILIRRDHVIEDMLRGVGATVRQVTEPFDPERGAYDRDEAAPAGSHAKHYDHGHSHDHGHDHAHGHSHPHPHGHGHDGQ